MRLGETRIHPAFLGVLAVHGQIAAVVADVQGRGVVVVLLQVRMQDDRVDLARLDLIDGDLDVAPVAGP